VRPSECPTRRGLREARGLGGVVSFALHFTATSNRPQSMFEREQISMSHMLLPTSKLFIMCISVSIKVGCHVFGLGNVAATFHPASVAYQTSRSRVEVPIDHDFCVWFEGEGDRQSANLFRPLCLPSCGQPHSTSHDFYTLLPCREEHTYSCRCGW
jgi:hypothetical protein